MLSRFSWLKPIIKLGALAFFMGLACVSAVILYLSPALPSAEQLRVVKLQTPLKVFSADEVLIGEFGEQKRSPINYDQIPSQYVHAILSAEDDNFFNHHGVDLLAFVRAGIQIITSGEIQSGGSTITMQVARNFFLTFEQTFTRKFNEILLALQIEHELSKEEILELYANKIFFGKRAYGVQAAANIYYGKDIGDLNLAQLAMIAGIPVRPSDYNPVNNPERALLRRNWILDRMLQLNYISEQDHKIAKEAPITAQDHGSVIEVNAPYVAEMVRTELYSRYGSSAYEDGYEVITTIDSELQQTAAIALQNGLLTYDDRHGYRGAESRYPNIDFTDEDALKSALAPIGSIWQLVPALVTAVHEQSAEIYIRNHGPQTLEWDDGISETRRLRTQNWRGEPPELADEVFSPGDLIRVRQIDGRWRFDQVPNAQAAFVALDPYSGGIVALRGGFDFYFNNFNRVTAAKRQPGSSLKPFLYTSALENSFTPATLINDAPIVFEDAALEDIWRPENDSGKFYGPTRLREALYTSRNLVSIRILRELGLRTARETMKRFGFEEEDLAKNLTLALGSQALTPLKVASGYAVFANGGYLVEPYLIEEIRNQTGELIFRSESPRVCNHECLEEVTMTEAPNFAEQVSGEGTQTMVSEIISSIGEPKNEETPYQYPQAEQVLDPRTHFLIDSILKDVIKKGTGRRALVLERNDIAGKTGTTNGPRDAWFSGYSPHMVATAWVGFDDNSLLGNSEFGGTAALPIWIDFMRVALQDEEEVIFEQPPGLVTARINPETGNRALPSDSEAIFEYFLRENTPAELSGSMTSGSTSTENSDLESIF